MIVLSWNCRGLGQEATIPALSELARVRRPDVIFLFEHISYGVRIEQLRVKLNFNSCFSVDCVGRSGGIAVFWNNSNNIAISSYSRNHIDLNINESNGQWRLTGYYGIPDRGRCHVTHDLLRQLASLNNLPWVVIGDYNDLLTSADKRGRVEHPQRLFRAFREAITDCNLMDIPLIGYQFTWFKSRGTPNMVEERLDHSMGNPTWHGRFPRASLHNLVAPVSDHNPILLDTEPAARHFRRKGFRFENHWLDERELQTVVSKCWRGFGDLEVPARLVATSDTFTIWGNRQDSKFRMRKRELEAKIDGLQRDMSASAGHLYKEARSELGLLHIQEESFWRQRAKAHWLRDGDLNTRFFHATTSARRKKKWIVKLKNDEDTWIEGQQGLCSLIAEYFTTLFEANSTPVNDDLFLNAINPYISDEQNAELIGDFTREEFTYAIKQMHPDKSPGPNGYNPAFFQRCWDIVGEDVFQESVKWLRNSSLPNGMNNTNVVLIPKCENPQTVKDLRPISLCNVVYKIMSKVLCNRLKRVLLGLVNRAQSAFIEGRSIQDNVLIAFEILHSMKNKRRGRIGDIALKIDINKAYDRVLVLVS